MSKELQKLSIYVSYVLRHDTKSIGLHIDSQGWVSVDEFLEKAKSKSGVLTREILQSIVASDDKQRYSFANEGALVRANQGHSNPLVNITFKAQVPPIVLLHGTASRFLSDIKKQGLTPQKRQYVHLSVNHETATDVGDRHGVVVVLEVDAKAMLADGYQFYLSDNNVWLTKTVPPKYLRFPQ